MNVKLFRLIRSWHLLFLIGIMNSITASAQTFSVDTVLYNGSTSKYINLVFMGDGYKTSELPSFINHVQGASNYIFSISPFKEYKNYFNVFAIKVSSIESGSDHPSTAADCPTIPTQPIVSVNTHFNSTFDFLWNTSGACPTEHICYQPCFVKPFAIV